jgi:hypothetical protein
MTKTEVQTSMKYPPTDLKILNKIYENHYGDYVQKKDVYIEVDVGRLSKELKADYLIVMMRFYQHFNAKHFSIGSVDGVKRLLFNVEQDGPSGKLTHRVNFSLLASVLADLRQQHEQFRSNYLTAVLSAVFAAISAAGAIVPILREGARPPAVVKPAPIQVEKQKVDAPKTDALVTPAKK